MGWLEMPLPVLQAYAEAMPTITAEESLVGIVDSRVGSLAPKPADAQRHVRRLERLATAGHRARPADPQRLRAAGIGVEYHRGTTG